MQNILNVLAGIASFTQQTFKILQIGYRFKIVRTLFLTEHSIQITSDCDMLTISSDLADVVIVINDLFKRCTVLYRIGLATDPTRNHHPYIQGTTDDRISSNQFADLIVSELALVINQGP